jgi:hypothetical protein
MIAWIGVTRITMKSNLKRLTVVSALLFGFAGSVSADDLLGQSLGATLSATDYFQVTCSNDGGGVPHHLVAQVNDNTAGTNVLSVQIHKGLLAKSSTDVTGANGVYSPLVTVIGNAGVYNVIVDKTTAAARTYDLLFHCETSGNIHTGTSIAVKQNQ